MGQGDPGRQHQGRVIRTTLAKYSVMSDLRTERCMSPENGTSRQFRGDAALRSLSERTRTLATNGTLTAIRLTRYRPCDLDIH